MRLKYLLIGLFAGMLLATAGTSFAADAIERVTASLRPDYKVVIDGEAVKLEQPPLVYNGRSYLPVRSVGDLVGKDVTFKGNTIYINEKEGVIKMEDWISLRDLATNHGVSVTISSDQWTIGEIVFPAVKRFVSNEIVVVNTSHGELELLFKSNEGTFVKIADLKRLGIIN